VQSVPDGSEWSASRPDRFIHKKMASGYSLIGRLGGPQSRSGHGGKESNLSLPGNEPRASSLCPSH
jgi:hypothetical protein